MQENKPVLIVGLGNPGAQYVNTRHNIGWMALDKLAGADASWRKEKNALTTHIDVDGRKVILVKPQTFMNNSGVAVGALMAFYKIPLDNIVVIHDDMDLPVGAIREKSGGGSAGHNGIRSIDATIGREYFRIRLGVGHPRDINSPINPADWVLGRFSPSDMEKIIPTIESINI